MTNVTSIHSYGEIGVREAMKKLTTEANEHPGYVLVGFQIVESEQLVVALYRKSPGTGGDTFGGASLFGE